MSLVKSKTEKVTKEKKTAKKEPAEFGTKKIHPNPSFKKEGVDLQMAVFNKEGQEVEKINLNPGIFGLKINSDLIKQVFEAQLSQARIPYAHTKNRGEVSGGGKKPWRQKGTGRARHGSTRSPIWKGGGVTHGPRKDRNFAKDINKKMRRAALLMVLSGKVRDNEMLVLDDLKLEAPKTKLMAKIMANLKNVKSDLGKGGLIVLSQKDQNVILASRNIPKFMTIGANTLNVADLLNHRYIIIPKDALGVIEKTFLKSSI